MKKDRARRRCFLSPGCLPRSRRWWRPTQVHSNRRPARMSWAPAPAPIATAFAAPAAAPVPQASRVVSAPELAPPTVSTLLSAFAIVMLSRRQSSACTGADIVVMPPPTAMTVASELMARGSFGIRMICPFQEYGRAESTPAPRLQTRAKKWSKPLKVLYCFERASGPSWRPSRLRMVSEPEGQFDPREIGIRPRMVMPLPGTRRPA